MSDKDHDAVISPEREEKMVNWGKITGVITSPTINVTSPYAGPPWHLPPISSLSTSSNQEPPTTFFIEPLMTDSEPVQPPPLSNTSYIWVIIPTTTKPPPKTEPFVTFDPNIVNKPFRVVVPTYSNTPTQKYAWTYGADYAALYALANLPQPTIHGEKIGERVLLSKWYRPFNTTFSIMDDDNTQITPSDVQPWKLNGDRGIDCEYGTFLLHHIDPINPVEDINQWREQLWTVFELLVVVDGVYTRVWDVPINFGKTAIETDGCHCHTCWHKSSQVCYQCACCCGRMGQNQVSSRKQLTSFYNAVRGLAHHTLDTKRLNTVVITKELFIRKTLERANTTFQLQGDTQSKYCQLVLGNTNLMVKRIIAYYTYQHLLQQDGEHIGVIQRRANRLSKVFAQEILIYLIASCIGEARHVYKIKDKQPWNFKQPKSPFINALVSVANDMNREPSWTAVRPLMKLIGPEEILIGLQDIFYKYDWSNHSGFGGERWGKITDLGLMLVRREISPAIFIDTIVSTVHNGGWAFNKWYSDKITCCVEHRDSHNNITTLLNLKAEDTSFLWENYCVPNWLLFLQKESGYKDEAAEELWASLNAIRGRGK